MKKKSISNKLILYYLLLGFFTIAIISVFSYYTAKQAITQRTYSQLSSLRTVNQKRIETFFTDRFNAVSLLANSSLAIDFVNNFNKHYSNTNSEIISFCKLFLNTGNYYTNMYFIKDSNSIFSISSNYSNENNNSKSILPNFSKYSSISFENIKAKVIEIISNDKKQINLFIICPIYSSQSNTNKSGYLICRLNEDFINKILFEDNPESGFGYSVETYLVGNDSLLRSSSRFLTNNKLTKLTNNSLSSLSETISKTIESVDYRGAPVYSSISKINIDGLNWYIFSDIDVSEAMATVKGLLKIIIILSIIIGILVLIFTLLISRKITYPIVLLNKAAEKIGEGNFNTTLDINTKDEFEMLAATFNQMAENIKAQQIELIEREERLKHFYDATIDGIILYENNKPLLVNHALSIMTGFKEDELMRMSVSNLIELNEIKQDFNVLLNPITYETSAKGKFIRSFPVEIQEKSIEYKGKMVKAIVIRDISKRVEVEKELDLQRRKSISWVIDGQEIERQRLARELHDGLGQSLIAIKLKLERISDKHDEKTPVLVNEIKEMFQNSIDDIRRITYEIMPAGLQEFGVENAITKLCSKVNDSSDIEMELNIENLNFQIDTKTSLYIYRIVQEAINNSIKHAKPRKLSVALYPDENFIDLIIADDGKGFKFDLTYKFVGSGLYNIKERVKMLDGSFKIKTDIGKGTIIFIKIPVKNETI